MSVGSAALPRMQIWVENSVHHTFDHNIWEHVCKGEEKFKCQIPAVGWKLHFVLFVFLIPWTHRVPTAAGTGLSERAGPAGVRAYWKESTEEKSEGAWEGMCSV